MSGVEPNSQTLESSDSLLPGLVYRYEVISMRIGFLVGARLAPLVYVVATSVALGQTAFDLVTDFSASQNPNGSWSYGWMSSSTDFILNSTSHATYGLALQEWREASLAYSS